MYKVTLKEGVWDSSFLFSDFDDAAAFAETAINYHNGEEEKISVIITKEEGHD